MGLKPAERSANSTADRLLKACYGSRWAGVLLFGMVNIGGGSGFLAGLEIAYAVIALSLFAQ